VCAYRLGNSQEALQAFNVCVGAAGERTSKPVQAQILFDRGLAHSGTGADREALEDYNLALKYDPSMGKAALNRGLLHFKQAAHEVSGKRAAHEVSGRNQFNQGAAHEVSGRNQHYQQALNDLNLALANGVPPAVVHYNQALIYQAQGNIESARASVRQALEYEPNHQEAHTLLKQLRQKR
jgi:tetratricopeptide (TPR) repeat protein